MTGYRVCTVIAVLSLAYLQNGEDFSSDSNDKKINVVLFLAKTSTSETYTQDSGIKYLNFVEKTRVKHCADTEGGTATNEEVPSPYLASGSDCKQLLKTGIYALIGYCRNVMGMTTAIASLENDTFSNGLRFKKSSSEDFEIRYNHPRRLVGRPDQILNQLHRKSQYLTQPEHTEVFKIRSKRQNPPEDLHNLETVPDANDPKWDVFGIMANIKLTFFGKLFEDKNKEVSQNTQTQLMDQLGKVSENSLFDLVKETLANIQEGDCGFLMVVIGGYLNEICDIYSTLMQSVKHVVENTDERNTLIVVTGSCPLVEGENQEGNQGQGFIPVYVRGPPRACSISISAQLYDVPYAIKNLLVEINGGSFFSGARSKRSKRHALLAKSKRSSAPLIDSSHLLITSCILLVLN